ncbi:uncharacterized protein N7459_006379 [Penicillium hispanicum]|uniref:uncharacterized protein n=1 Tax=Penicillium hispanicum TaxID=1080232 RepID=UPI002540A4E7|nr:uncharacterized protein N7459_006379 [Penicillium hispanicum]KAJ5577415.1 hypothetical protein N7459_006379 [Penicillium hispanicum]
MSSFLQVTSSPRSLSYHLRTLWLLTYSDLAPVVLPHTIAGLANFWSGWVLLPESVSMENLPLIRQSAFMIFWLWFNLLSFDLANQRLDDSVQEDMINKPWRPIPAKRLGREEARHLLMLVIALTLCFSSLVGGLRETLIMVMLNWFHNDLKGGDENFWFRNLLNALAFMDFITGASLILGGPRAMISPAGHIWTAIMGSCVFCTISVQDLGDQAGDEARGRHTAPLILGDLPCRVIIAVCAMICSLGAPFYLQVPALAHIGVLLLGLVVSGRTLFLKSVASDKATFRIWWSLWLVVLYALPTVSSRAPMLVEI